MSPVQGFRYQPFYCEENAWWLCDEPEVSSGDAYVVFIANRFGHCPVAKQRAVAPDQVIWWDYHVVVLDAARRIWDLDTRLGLPLPAVDWLVGSFPFINDLPENLHPTFRLIPCSDYRRDFASDRSHMRDADWRWQHPPPPWPTIGNGMNLDRYRHPSVDKPGELLDWQGLRKRVG